jgi:hypothetical protein
LTSILLVHAAATLFMTGVIWFVQIVHYPLFDRVGRDGFAEYEAEHARRTTWVVAPVMLVEAAAAVLLVATRPADLPASWVWTGLALLAGIWLSTAVLQVPRHAALSAGFDAAALRMLVGSNWIRTAAWSVRGGLALAMLSR